MRIGVVIAAAFCSPPPLLMAPLRTAHPMLCALPGDIVIKPTNQDALDLFCDDLIPKGDEERRGLMEKAVRSWPDEERKGLSDKVADILSARAGALQKDAIAAHERGEDVTEASQQLQTMVDMCVQVKLLTKQLANGEI